jgi:hypothetical protein
LRFSCVLARQAGGADHDINGSFLASLKDQWPDLIGRVAGSGQYPKVDRGGTDHHPIATDFEADIVDLDWSRGARRESSNGGSALRYLAIAQLTKTEYRAY